MAITMGKSLQMLWEKFKHGKNRVFLYKKLKNSFNMEVILELIKEKAKNKNLVIITGVGKIYPIVRSHALLNNLQNLFNETKVILFFPREYTTTDLRLFGFKDNNYYRAFKL